MSNENEVYLICELSTTSQWYLNLNVIEYTYSKEKAIELLEKNKGSFVLKGDLQCRLN